MCIQYLNRIYSILGSFCFKAACNYQHYPALSETIDANVLKYSPSCIEHSDTKSDNYLHFTITI